MWLLLVSIFTMVELNCENLFDCKHDSLKEDTEFLPESPRHWTRGRYWHKLDQIARAVLDGGEDSVTVLPDLVALCEVENDSVVFDLTRRSLLRHAEYNYFITESSDMRGIDVALLYNRFTFAPIAHAGIRVAPVKGMRPTRNILYVCGRVRGGDTLHVFVVHAPSRYGGEKATRPFRMAVAERLCLAIDSIRACTRDAKIAVMGDFNDEPGCVPIDTVCGHGMVDVAAKAAGRHGAKGTYRYKGRWSNIDHCLLSPPLAARMVDAWIKDVPFLIEEDKIYGGVKPFRTYYGFQYRYNGVSDHLPLVVRLRM